MSVAQVVNKTFCVSELGNFFDFEALPAQVFISASLDL